MLLRSFLQLKLRHDSTIGVSMKLKGRIVDLLFFFMSDEQKPRRGVKIEEWDDGCKNGKWILAHHEGVR